MRAFNILLVDDEEFAIRGIEMGLDWERLSVEKIYKAHNMETAVRMLGTYAIDIVVTDIDMPNGSGLDLVAWIKEHCQDVVCIFYTGYADFHYAQAAVRLGVEDYLLKPVPYGELEDLLERVERKILSRDESKKMSQVWDDISKEDDENIIAAVKRCITENIDTESSRDYLAACVNVTPNYLFRLFKKKEGISLTEFIVKKRIAIAKQLLSEDQSAYYSYFRASRDFLPVLLYKAFQGS